MCAVHFPCLIPSRHKQKLEFLEQDMTLQLKSEQIHKQDYIAVKINFVVLIMPSLIIHSSFGDFISNECASTLMILSMAFNKPVINFF